ncbi:MAG: nucleoside monophosphate kinase, partial [Patescibacteria group bacterium]|nr:nucleoside monophosphate kinase [Patescibacteria group bacterium]
MKITISGDPGSGKGTVANLLVKKLKWPVINAGDFKREIAFQKNMNILEFSKKYTTAELDDMIDSNTKDFCAKNENAIIDGRRAWFHVPDSFKVFLKCDPDEAAKRIY